MNGQKFVIHFVLSTVSAGLIGVGCKGSEVDGKTVIPEALMSQDAQTGNDQLRRLYNVRPLLNRIERRKEGGFIAHFGYENRGETALSMPVGKVNSFYPQQKDRGQPTTFEPGRHDDVVKVEFGGSIASVIWKLGQRIVTSFSRFPDRDWQHETCGDSDARPGDDYSTSYLEKDDGTYRDRDYTFRHHPACGDG